MSEENIKLKSFFQSKENNKMKRQPIEWEKTLANYLSNESEHPKYIKNSNNTITTRKLEYYTAMRKKDILTTSEMNKLT